MARKKDVIRKIDQKSKASGAPLPLIQEDQPTPPAFALIPEPTDLVLVGQAIMRSTQAPLVAVAIRWQEAPNISPDYYNVDYSENVDFSNSQRRRALTTSATIDSLKANGVTYYFRVQAVVSGIYSPFSNILTVVTMTDDTPAPDVTSLSAQFINGDLFISWIRPLSEIYKDAQIRIYNAAHSIHYGTFTSTSEGFIWSAAENLAATSQVGLTSVSIDVYSRSWSNVLSLTPVNVTATSVAPATPSGYTISWIGDTGLAAADLRASWNATPSTDSYDLTFDSVAYQTRDTAYTYSYERNVRDHVPTLASGDPSILFTLAARNKLNQVSVPVNVTVANLAPPSSLIALTATKGFAQIAASVAVLSGAIIQDFDHYEYALLSGATALQSFISPDPVVQFLVSGAGTYGVSVKAVDKFNQKSNAVVVAGLVLDTLTIEQLRAEAIYTDSFSNASSVLNAVMKDGILYTGTLGDAVRYNNTSGVWNWLKASRPLVDRYKTISLSFAWPNNAKLYFEFYDGTNTVYYAGPITTGAAGQQILTKYTVLATARTNAIVKTPLGNGNLRYDLPNIQEARDTTLWFDTIGSNLDIYEFYPRRLVQSDDIDAENIRGINIASAAVTADKISVINLAAVSAFIGQLNIDATGWLYQGTGTGASPTTGLKIFNSGGIGKLSTYNTGVEQITLDTDGKLKWGAGVGVMDVNGIAISVLTQTSLPGVRAYGLDWFSGVTQVGSLRAYNHSAAGGQVHLSSANGPLGGSVYINGVSFTTSLGINVPSGDINIGSGGLNVNQGVAIGTAVSNPGANNLRVNGNIALGGNFAATRGLSIFGDNNYVSWNNGAGTEKWVAGLETAGSGRWILYSSVAGNYAIIADQSLNVSVGTVMPTSKFQVNAATGDGIYVSDSAPRIALGNHAVMGSRTKGLFLALATAAGHYVGGTANGDGLLFTESGALWLGANQSLDMGIGTGHNVSIANKLMIGSTGTAPTHTLQLINDDAAKTTTTTWATTSTRQAKDKIKTRKSALARIKQLRLTDYETNGKYNTIEGAKGVGFIAEEARSVYPNAVKEVSYTDIDGIEQRYLTFNPHEVFMDYAVAIQELEAEIEALKAK